MSVSESAVLSSLLAEITLQGFILAVYAFLTPFFGQIVETRQDLLKEKNDSFLETSKKITPQSTEDEMSRLQDIHREIKQLKTFPKYLDWGVAIVFAICGFSSCFALGVLAGAENFGWEIFGPLIPSVAGFLLIGIYAIIEMSRAMRHKWRVLEEKKAEAEKMSYDKIEELERKIDELKNMGKWKDAYIRQKLSDKTS